MIVHLALSYVGALLLNAAAIQQAQRGTAVKDNTRAGSCQPQQPRMCVLQVGCGGARPVAAGRKAARHHPVRLRRAARRPQARLLLPVLWPIRDPRRAGPAQ
jgi:hypothetical protein